SRQQGLSSKQTVQQAHHRMDGRPYGKLLPRYAGPIAEFVLTHPQASRYDVLGFIDRTFGVRVSRVALYHFLKKFGLDQVPGTAQARAAAPAVAASQTPPPPPAPLPGPEVPAPLAEPVLAGPPVPLPAPPF